jgi:hypothetical protein
VLLQLLAGRCCQRRHLERQARSTLDVSTQQISQTRQLRLKRINGACQDGRVAGKAAVSKVIQRLGRYDVALAGVRCLV